MRILITGSESFVARELIKQCREKRFEVFGIDAIKPEKPSYNFIQGDIRDRNIGSKFPSKLDAVIHLAALSRDSDCKGHDYECFDANVMGTLNLMRASKMAAAQQFIFASSEWVYESFDGKKEKDEKAFIDIAKHHSEYALSKLVSEANLRQAFQNGFMDVTILRFAIIYGPRKTNWSAVESISSKVKRGEKISVGSLKNGRRFIHVADIASGIIGSFGLKGFEIINLSGDKLITLADIIRTSEKIFKTAKTKVEETNPKEINLRNPSNKKAKKILGWTPKINLETGLRSAAVFL